MMRRPLRDLIIPAIKRDRRWSIAVYAGDSPFSLSPPPGVVNPVLRARDVTDIRARYVADPFMIRKASRWYMFFEVLDEKSGLGKIAYADSDDALSWTYKGLVLEEPFHLSYPYVFECDAEVYMVPEAAGTMAVGLYRAVQFPIRWARVAELLVGKPYCDSSLLHVRDAWWLFTSAVPERNDTLLLFRADRLEGPWIEHPKSPIVNHNPHLARPAGRVFECDGRLFRYAQDDAPWYGRQVWGLELTQLSELEYSEKPVSEDPILRRSRFGWNSLGMHHVDPHRIDRNRWIACVDGHRNAWTISVAAKSIEWGR